MGRSLTNSRNSPWALGEAVYLNHLLVFEREQGRANRPGARLGTLRREEACGLSDQRAAQAARTILTR